MIEHMLIRPRDHLYQEIRGSLRLLATTVSVDLLVLTKHCVYRSKYP